MSRCRHPERSRFSGGAKDLACTVHTAAIEASRLSDRISGFQFPNYKITRFFLMLLKLTILPGDGIGPEVTEQAVLVIQAVAERFEHQLELQHQLIGAAALAAVNDPLPPETIQACLSSSAVLLGAVGSPAFDHNPGHLRPEAGLLRIRRELGAYANLRPAGFFPAFEDWCPWRAE